MSSYAKNKESGVEWIGEIPVAWDSKKLTFVTSYIGSGTTPKSDSDQYYRDGTIPWLVTGDLNDGIVSIVSNKINTLAIEAYPALKVWPARSLAIAMYGATIGKVGLLQFSTTVNQANCVFVFNSENCPKFWLYVFLANRSRIVSMSYGGGQPNISQELLKSLRFACPQKEEQSLISTYLDKKTSQIDSLVEKIERKFELLIEQRTTLISQCVTKGVDSNVQMKDSGVEWIGEIPIDWITSPLKYVVSSNDEVLSENTNPGYEFRYIEISDVNQFSGIGPGRKVSFSESPSRARRILRENDVLISTVRTYLRAIGTVRKCRDNLIGSTGFCVLRATQRILPSYLSYIVNSEQFVASVVSNSVGVSYPAINSSDLVNLKSALPSFHEQAQISQYLNKKTSQIDSLSERLQRKIELLKEYRQSLISSVVTGKIKVTEDAP